MKRFAAIFSLIIMLITAIQPVITMHYCGDELSSLQIYQTIDNYGVCCDDIEHHDASITGNSCCETEVMKLTTDEYQTKTVQPEVRISAISIDLLGHAIINQLSTTESDSSTLLTTLKFPPKGLYLEDVSILTYICIYRI
ncbi:MAG: hypothetical protein ITF98_11505 [Fermentimonas sp.]|nr:hypothetical protein [Fermentimonas sp.]